MKEIWQFMCYKLAEFIQKCSQLTLEQTLTWAKDYKNPKLFRSMLIWIQNFNFKAKVVICIDFTISLQKNC